MGLKMIKCEKCGAYIFEDSECPYCKEAENEAPFNSAAYSGFAGASPAVKVKEGIPLPFAIIGSVICLFALMLYVGSFYYSRVMYNHGMIMGYLSFSWYSIINILIFLTGIIMCVVTVKKPVLAIIPIGMKALYQIGIWFGGSTIFGLIFVLIMIAAAVMFVLASVKNNRSGIKFAVISMVLFCLTAIWIVLGLLYYSTEELRYITDLSSSMNSFAFYNLYTAFALISLGVLIRNVKSAKAGR